MIHRVLPARGRARPRAARPESREFAVPDRRFVSQEARRAPAPTLSSGPRILRRAIRVPDTTKKKAPASLPALRLLVSFTDSGCLVVLADRCELGCGSPLECKNHRSRLGPQPTRDHDANRLSFTVLRCPGLHIGMWAELSIAETK